MDDDALRRQLEKLGITGTEDDSIRIDPETGKVQVEHWYGNTDTGIVIDPETGKVQEEHWYGNTDTGTVIDPKTGKVQEEHWYGNTDTGTVIDPATGKVQEEHWYGNTDTGIVIDPATGKVQEEHWYGNTDLRPSPRANVEAKDSSHPGTSASASGTSASAPGTSAGLGSIGAAIIIIICLAVAHDWKTSPATEGRSPELAEEPPEQIADRGACPYEGCTYGERWLARQDVNVYTAPPAAVGLSASSLHKSAVVHAGEWVKTQTGIVLARRHDGQVGGGTTYGAVVKNGPPLRKGQTVPLYSYLGEGCWTAWIDGRFLAICGVDDAGGRPPQNEWWIEIKLPNGTTGWTASADKAFISEEGLNSELGKKIEDPELSLPDKLANIEALTKEGADLNGSGGTYGTTPLEAAIRRKDIELLKSLLSMGMHLRSGDAESEARSGELRSDVIRIRSGLSCPASAAAQVALQPGGDLMLEFLLENGLQLGCLPEPPLISFLRFGIAADNYPVDRAIRISEILVKSGARVRERDSQGKSIFDVLDEAKDASRLDALREALNAAATEERDSPDSPDSGEMAQVYRVGNGVSAPQVVYKEEPRYSEEARERKIQGTVVLSVLVDKDGSPRDVRVLKSLERSLDLNAIESVRKWRFRPGSKDGVPVLVAAKVETNFRLF